MQHAHPHTHNWGGGCPRWSGHCLERDGKHFYYELQQVNVQLQCAIYYAHYGTYIADITLLMYYGCILMYIHMYVYIYGCWSHPGQLGCACNNSAPKQKVARCQWPSALFTPTHPTDCRPHATPFQLLTSEQNKFSATPAQAKNSNRTDKRVAQNAQLRQSKS